MVDVHSKKVRSYNMSRIRARNTKPEIQVRKFLYSNGLRFRLFNKGLPGTPDIILPEFKSVIFVHGCFWHFHKKCNEGRIPSSNSKFWEEILERNVKKDANNIKALKKDSWRVFVIWECEIEKQFEKTFKRIVKNIEKIPEV